MGELYGRSFKISWMLGWLETVSRGIHPEGVLGDAEGCGPVKGVARLPIIRKIVRSDCAVCERESYCYFGVAFNSFPTLSRVVFDNEGFASCLKVKLDKTKNDEEGS